MNIFKKYIAVLLTIALILFYTLPVGMVLAVDEVILSPLPSETITENTEPTPSSTPTPTPIDIDNGSVVSTDSNTVSDTGNNVIDASPSPSPELLSSDSVDAPIATESVDLTAPEAGNSVADNSQNQSNTSTINTGDAVSNTSIENNLNVSSVNSKVVNQTVNIFITENGDINLSDPYTIASSAIQSRPEDPVINVSAVNVNNFAYLNNDVVSFANSGNNSIQNDGEATINTGNACSVVSILNKVNFTIVNSEIHIVTINLFGKLNGNIILPNLYTSTNCSNCGVNLNQNSSAGVSDNVSSVANSGDNSISASSEEGLITTGDAKSAVNVLNIVNNNLIGVDLRALYINNFGEWNGEFVGWDNNALENNGSGLVLSGMGSSQAFCATCSGTVNVNNNAWVVNNVISFANTGNNSINGGNGLINTGKANSVVSLMNFINSSFINSFGFFGFINIFGNWNGHIGGKNEIAAFQATNNKNSETVNIESIVEPQAMESGGMFSVEQKNNVGKYILPGDTITFSINVKNIGTGEIYAGNLELYLITNGVNIGGASYDLGNLLKGESVDISTGIVLPKNIPAGNYIARAFVSGAVGPNNAMITGLSDSFFNVIGNTVLDGSGLSVNTPNNVQEVLGTHYPVTAEEKANNNDYGPLYALITVVMTYLILRGIREKDKIMVIFGKRITLDERMRAFKMFLL